MATIFDLEEEKKGAWFDMEGGGKVHVRTLSADSLRAIRKQTVKKKTEFRKVEGTPGRFEYEETNEELQQELFWDHCIIAWEDLIDGKKKPIPCTKENKILLMSRSAKFAKFIGECLSTLQADEAEQAEELEKN